jgi:hypothetical protein
MNPATVCSLLGKLLVALLACPPVYILAKYLRWCSKQEKDCDMEPEADA